MPASLSTRRPASTARRVSSPSRPTNSPWRRPRPACNRRCWKPCWATRRPHAARSSSHSASSGRRSWNGCRSGAGMTSSVTRSTPRSSSQSRISAQRSKVAGSTSCSDTAMAATDAADHGSAHQLPQRGGLGVEDASPAVAPADHGGRLAIRLGARARRRSRGPGRRVAGTKPWPRAPIACSGGRRRARDDRRAAGRGLERDEPEGLVLARHDDAAGARVAAREPVAIARRTGGSSRASADPSLRARRAQRLLQRPAADDPQRPRILAARGRLQQLEHALLAREPTDVQHVVAATHIGPRAERLVQPRRSGIVAARPKSAIVSTRTSRHPRAAPSVAASARSSGA